MSGLSHHSRRLMLQNRALNNSTRLTSSQRNITTTTNTTNTNTNTNTHKINLSVYNKLSQQQQQQSSSLFTRTQQLQHQHQRQRQQRQQQRLIQLLSTSPISLSIRSLSSASASSSSSSVGHHDHQDHEYPHHGDHGHHDHHAYDNDPTHFSKMNDGVSLQNKCYIDEDGVKHHHALCPAYHDGIFRYPQLPIASGPLGEHPEARWNDPQQPEPLLDTHDYVDWRVLRDGWLLIVGTLSAIFVVSLAFDTLRRPKPVPYVYPNNLFNELGGSANKVNTANPDNKQRVEEDNAKYQRLSETVDELLKRKA